MEEKDKKKLFEMLFLQMVMSLNEAALIQMGKIINPVTEKIEKNLAQARGTIDLLRMLKDKTKNNLVPQEKQILEQCIVDLEMNFVYEKEHEQQQSSSQPAQEQDVSPETSAPEESVKNGENDDLHDSPGQRPGMNN